VITLCLNFAIFHSELQNCIQDIESSINRVHSVAQHFSSIPGIKERLTYLVDMGSELTRFSDVDKVPMNRVMGCAAQVWMVVTLNDNGTVCINADSDSEISRGLAAVLIKVFNGATPAEIDSFDLKELDEISISSTLASSSRTNSFRNMFNTLKKRANALVGELPRFPSLLVTKNTLTPQGTFAEAQARYLEPDSSTVDRLASLLESKRVGVVAHFYMDPEVQGVLTSAAARWPHIHISGAFAPAH
jgi:quinolinate synthase